jgi:hypothetical protein
MKNCKPLHTRCGAWRSGVVWRQSDKVPVPLQQQAARKPHLPQALLPTPMNLPACQPESSGPLCCAAVCPLRLQQISTSEKQHSCEQNASPAGVGMVRISRCSLNFGTASQACIHKLQHWGGGGRHRPGPHLSGSTNSPEAVGRKLQRVTTRTMACIQRLTLGHSL